VPEATPIPEGVDLPTEEHRIFFEQIAGARAREHWRQVDLIILSKIALLEIRIRRAWAELDDTSLVIENMRGTKIPNPMTAVVDALQRQQLALVRSLSLGVRASHPYDLNASGKTVGDIECQGELDSGGIMSLLG